MKDSKHTIQDMKIIAAFFAMIKAYLRMKRIEQKQNV